MTENHISAVNPVNYKLLSDCQEDYHLRASQLFLPTLREVPAEAELISHRLLLRAGFVRKLAAGIYSYLPLGWRVHEKIAQIVREEMNRIGGQEMHMPTLVSKELLEESGRSNVDVLFHLKDRGAREFALGFTHEEVITDIVRTDVRSWKQLPLMLYQIQTKFRDEPRPRGGLIRVREFTMKDAYSFDVNEEGLDEQYQAAFAAYGRIFTRCGLEYLAVDADAGAIGGSINSEFMLLADSGEDTVLRCEACGYAANAERADIAKSETETCVSECEDMEIVSTPDAHTVTQVCDLLKVDSTRLIKTIIVTDGEAVYAALIRGDRDLNLSKLGRRIGKPVEMADASTVERVTGAPVGFAGPVGLKDARIIADQELNGEADLVIGANRNNAHLVHVTPGRDFEVTEWADIRVAVATDRCAQPECSGIYADAHGIEVGHIFKLGTKYSKAMHAQVQNETGEMQDIVMGCYGLGVSRTLASAIEAHHDDDGIVWPMSIAPFEVVVIPVNPKAEDQLQAAKEIYSALIALGVDALLDDRNERSGVKFKDADLIGYPIRIVAGRALAEGNVEVTMRNNKEQTIVALAAVANHVARLVLEAK